MSEQHSDHHFHRASVNKKKKRNNNPALKKQKNIHPQGYPLSGLKLPFAYSVSDARAAFQSVWLVLAVKG